jgi:hypothetical protein
MISNPRNSLLLALAFLSVTQIASADQGALVNFDLNYKSQKTCISDATSYDQAFSCAKKTAKRCISENTDDQSHSAYGGCFAFETAIWKILYTEEVDNILHWVKNRQTYSVIVKRRLRADFVSKFMETEHRWSQYAQSHCAFENRRWGSGNAGITDLPACVSHLYIERIYRLKTQNWIQ